MRESDIRAALSQHWAASDANDFELEHQIYREDAVLEYPQSCDDNGVALLNRVRYRRRDDLRGTSPKSLSGHTSDRAHMRGLHVLAADGERFWVVFCPLDDRDFRDLLWLLRNGPQSVFRVLVQMTPTKPLRASPRVRRGDREGLGLTSVLSEKPTEAMLGNEVKEDQSKKSDGTKAQVDSETQKRNAATTWSLLLSGKATPLWRSY